MSARVCRLFRDRLPGARASRALLSTLSALAVGLAAATPAQADVALHGTPTCKTQAFFGFGSFSLAAPAGASVGDVLVATIRRSDLFSFGGSGPAGWTQIGSVSGGTNPTYAKVATAGDLGSSWTFASMLGFTASITGTIVAFSGADPAAPFGAGATTSGTGTTIPLPDVLATRSGSQRYSAVITSANTNATYSGGLGEACDQAAAGASMSNASQGAGPGVTPSRTAALASGGDWVAQTLIIQPTSACAVGGRTMTVPGTISFPPVVLDGRDTVSSTTAVLSVSDLSDTAAGWSVTASSTRFTSGTQTLPPDATKVRGMSVSAGGTSCALPASSSVAYPLTLPAGSSPPPVKIANAGVGTGLGIANLTFDLDLAVPANARVGTYVSTWSFTLQASP